MLTGMAARSNEIKRHRNFSIMHFSGVATCRVCFDGHSEHAVRDCRPYVCYPAGGFG